MEIWKDVKDFEGMYRVSNYGNIMTIKKEPKIVKPVIDNKGYHRYSFYKNGKAYTVKYHRVVAQAFIPNPENKPQVNHKNGIKTDNRAENLEWLTNDENMHHSKINNLRKGKMPSGENHHNSKLTNEQVRYIKENYVKSSREFGCGAFARKFNVDMTTVHRIVQGKYYTNV